MKRLYPTILLLFCCFINYSQIVFETTFGEPDCYEEAFTAYGSELYVVSSNANCSQITGDYNGNIVLLNVNGDSISAVQNFMGCGFYAFEDSPSGNKFIFAGGEKSGLIYDTIILSKVNDLFNKEWEKKYTLGVCNNVVYDIAVVNDGYLFTGFYSTQNCLQNISYDAFVLKIDKDGNEIWLTPIGGTGNQQFYSVKEMANGNIAAFGWTNNTSSNLGKYFLTQFNANGDSLSSFIIDIAGDFRGYGMDVTPDGNFILNGTRNNNEVVIMKTDATGNVLWSKNLGVPCGSSYYKAYHTLDKQYAFSFITSGDIDCETILVKTDTAGNELWNKVFPATVRTVTQPELGSFVLAGFKLRSDNFISDAYVARFDTTYNPTSVRDFLKPNLKNAEIFPNPVKNKRVKITFENEQLLPAEIIFLDITGKEILRNYLRNREEIFFLENDFSGVIFYNLTYNNKSTERGKLIR